MSGLNGEYHPDLEGLIMSTNLDWRSLLPGHCGSRRAVLKSAMDIATFGLIGAPLLGVSPLSHAAALTKEMRD